MSLMSDIGAAIKLKFDKNAVAMTKAQFNALAEERKANRAGSGFDEMGRGDNNYNNINMGMGVVPTWSNKFGIPVGTGTIKPKININGIIHTLDNINSSSNFQNIVFLPTAPTIYPYDTVLTAEQIASGVIKHADASNSGLIVNGKFDTDTSGWILNAGLATYDAVNSKISVNNQTGTTNQAFQQKGVYKLGKKNIVEFTVSDYVSGSIKVNFYKGSAYVYGPTIISNGTYSCELDVTETSQANIRFEVVNNTVLKVDNIAVYPADAISRSDLVFLESWHEDISEKNFVYPLGNVQYLGGNTDGLTGIANGSFTGFETYSLFGNWQTPSALIGKGYVWSSLTEAQRKAFIANPENNCYLDGDKVIQVRYRVRVMLGEDTNSMARATVQGKAVVPSTVLYTAPATTVDAGLYSNTTSTYTYTGTTAGAISITNVGRRNQGIYHNVYNPNGTKLASDGLDCFRTTVSFTSISDCFDPAKLLAASGYIGTVSGRPDGLFYDQVHEGDIQDLRNSSKKVEDYNRLIGREFNKLVAGTYRGKEGERFTEIKTQTTTGTIATVEVNDGTKYKSGDVVYIYDLTASVVKGRFVVKSISSNTLTVDTTFAKLANSYMISGASSTRTKSNTLLICDVFGNPSNYPSVWKTNETTFTTLHTAEDGTSLLPDGTLDTFKLSRKANATPLLCLRSTDSGATWTSFTPTFNTSTNEITLINEPASNLVMVYYQTHTSMAVPVVNSEVLEIGDVYASCHNNKAIGNDLFQTLLSKSGINTGDVTFINSIKVPNTTISNSGKTLFATSNAYNNTHSSILLQQTSPVVYKVFPYLTRLNGKAYLNLVFKEMKHNGTSWGDDSKFNIVDNVSTTTDNNAQTVLIGQKTVELPYFIGADE